MFKALHRGVVNDTGVPSFKKRGVYVPGHEEVLDPEERDALYKGGSARGSKSRKGSISAAKSAKMQGSLNDNQSKQSAPKDQRTSYGGRSDELTLQ